MSTPEAHFSSIWIVLAAGEQLPGERLRPILLIARDGETGRVVEIDRPMAQKVDAGPPYPISPHSLIITINANELVGCHLALGWRVPERIVDLLVEFRNITNGGPALPVGGLASALLWFGQSTAGAIGGGTSPVQIRRRLEAVAGLFQAMRASLDLGRALLRGRFMCATARIEGTGVPVDMQTLELLKVDWRAIRNRVVEIVDRDFGVYTMGRFEPEAFEIWLARRGIHWPRTSAGASTLSPDVLREMARAYPDLQPFKELQTTLRAFDPSALTIGCDGRNRTPLRPFSSRTGRNQPSASASVLGTAAWVRNLIKPGTGKGLALLDWQQQEFGIAAALSGDTAMETAYRSGDPYLAAAVKANLAPVDATASSHPGIRDRFKACALGVQYGMGAGTLARQLRVPEIEATELLRAHRAAFPRFWSWSDQVETYAMLRRELRSVFGWRITVGSDSNPRSLRNFPMQANGAEMLRLACCLTAENGISVCAPIHDALLIEAPVDELDAAVAKTQRFMAEASATVLGGFALRTSVRVMRAPDRWNDPRGQAVWSAVHIALDTKNRPAHHRNATCAFASPRPISLYVFKKDGSHAAD